MEGGIFLTVKDLMKLLGTNSYSSAAREHLMIRDAIGKKQKRLTIIDYCKYEGLDYDYIWNFLRTKNKLYTR